MSARGEPFRARLWDAFHRAVTAGPLTTDQAIAAVVALELRAIRGQLERIGKVLEETEPAGGDVDDAQPWETDGVRMPPPTLSSAEAAAMVADADARTMSAVVAAIGQRGLGAIEELLDRAAAGDVDAQAELLKFRSEPG